MIRCIFAAAVLFMLVLTGCPQPQQQAPPRDPLEEAKAAHDAGDYHAAIELYTEYLVENPHAIKAIRERAFCYSATGNRHRMVTENHRILALDPDNVDALETLAGHWLFVQDFEKSQEYADRLMKVDPRNDYARQVSRAIIYEKKKDEEEAKWRAEQEAKKNQPQKDKKKDDKKDDAPDDGKKNAVKNDAKDDTPEDGDKKDAEKDNGDKDDGEKDDRDKDDGDDGDKDDGAEDEKADEAVEDTKADEAPKDDASN